MAGAAKQALGDEAPSSFQLRLQQQQHQQQQPQQQMDGGDRSSYGTGAGVGGKARSGTAPNRRKTPYDRPSQGRHASAGPHAASLMNGAAPGPPSSSSWLGAGLVGTASRFLTTGASYLFSSVFRRRENVDTPLALSNGGDRSAVELEDNGDDVVEVSQSKSMEVSDGQGRPSHQQQITETSRSPELLWRKPKITSEEYIRLTQVLQTRLVDNGAGKDQVSEDHDMKGTADGSENVLEYGTPVGTIRWRDQHLNHVNDSRRNGSPHNGAVEPFLAAPGGRELNNGSDSPVEIARAFMGDRVARVPGSVSPAQAPLSAAANSTEPGPSSLPVSTSVVVTKSATNEYSRNIFQTPAITRSSRPIAGLYGTPYSRPIHGTAAREPPIRPSLDGSAPTRWTPIRAPLTSGPQSLKRRSNALDDGWASVGPIRRTKRKSTVAPSLTGSGLSRSFGQPSDGNAGEARLSKTTLLETDNRSSLFGENLFSRGKTIAGSSGLKNIDDRKGVSGAAVPAQSTETARRILETLDRMVPSPEHKKLDEELACVRRKPPGRLTDDMLNDRARRSMQDSGDLDLGTPELQKTAGYFSGQAAQKSTLSTANGKGNGKAISSSVLPFIPEEGAARVEMSNFGPHATSDSAQGISRNSRSLAQVDASTPSEQGGFRMSIDSDLQGSDSDREGARNVQKAVGGVTVSSASASGLGRPFGETTSFASDVSKSSSPAQIPTSSGISGALGSGSVRASALFPSGAPEFQNPQSPDSSRGKSSGSFSFQTTPSFNSNSSEPPPTPKAIPSPAMNGGAAASSFSELPLFQFGTATAEQPRVVFSAIPGTAGQIGAVGDKKKQSQAVFSTATSASFPSLSQGPLESGTPTASAVNASVKGIEGSTSTAVSVPVLLQRSAPASDQTTIPAPESSPATGFFGASSVSTSSFGLGTTPFGGASTSGLGSATSTSTMFQGFGKDVTSSSAATGSVFGSASGGATTFNPGSGLSFPKPPMAFAAGSSGSGVSSSSFSTGLLGASSVSTSSFGLGTTPFGGASTSGLGSASSTSTMFQGFGKDVTSSSAATGSVFGSASGGATAFTLQSPGSGLSLLKPPTAFADGPSGSGVSGSSFSFAASTRTTSASTPLFGDAGQPITAGIPTDVKDSQPVVSSVGSSTAVTVSVSAAPAFATAFEGAAPNSVFGEGSSKIQAPFSFGSSGAGSSASSFTFASKATTTSTGFPSTAKSPEATGASSQPTFGMANPSPALVSSSGNGALPTDTGGEHTSMDEMAEEPSVPVSGQVSVFQQPSTPSSGFMFGQRSTPAVQPPVFGQPPSLFGQSTPATGQTPFGQPPGLTGQTPFGQATAPTGQTLFGQATAPIGQTLFGQGTAPTGQIPFGQPSAPAVQPPVFGQPSAPPVQPPVFGQPNAPSGQPLFGQPSASLFSQPSAPSGQSEVFSFSAQSPSFEAGAQNPFSAGFSMGAGGPDQRQGRKYVKATKRTGGQRRGR